MVLLNAVRLAITAIAELLVRCASKVVMVAELFVTVDCIVTDRQTDR